MTPLFLVFFCLLPETGLDKYLSWCHCNVGQCRAKEVPLFLRYFKILSVDATLEMEPEISRSTE